MTCDCEAGPCWFSHRKTDSPTKPGTSVDWQHSEYIDTFWDSLTFVPRLRRRRQVAAEKKGCCAAGMRPSGWQDFASQTTQLCFVFFSKKSIRNHSRPCLWTLEYVPGLFLETVKTHIWRDMVLGIRCSQIMMCRIGMSLPRAWTDELTDGTSCLARALDKILCQWRDNTCFALGKPLSYKKSKMLAEQLFPNISPNQENRMQRPSTGCSVLVAVKPKEIWLCAANLYDAIYWTRISLTLVTHEGWSRRLPLQKA